MSTTKYISTTALANEMKMPAKDLFQKLLEKGFIHRETENWTLTDLGKEAGGVLKTHPQYGTYIAWDEDNKGLLISPEDEEDKLVNTTTLSKHFSISKLRMNPILSELGTIQSVQGVSINEEKEEKETSTVGFRDKFEAKHRAADGHYFVLERKC